MLPLDDDVDALRDRETTRQRCQKLAHELKRQMGPRAYEGFRGRALAYQTDEITALAFSDFLLEALGRARGTRELAREVVRTLPCERLRSGLRRALGDALDVEGDGPGPGPGSGSTTATKERGMKIETIAPGLVCLRKFLSVEQQEWLTRTSFEVGESDADSAAAGRGFFARDENGDGGTLRLNQGTRGRVILDVDAFPDGELEALCARAVDAAQNIDESMPDFNPTTVLVNFYKDGAEFKWHKDSEDPKLVKSKTGPPIVSFSVGLSADFGYKYSFEDPNHKTIRLNSGDVLLFGGPARMIVHSVLNVYPGSMPGHLRGKMLNGRLNVTVRDIGNGVIDTSQFPAYRVSYDGVQAEGNV